MNLSTGAGARSVGLRSQMSGFEVGEFSAALLIHSPEVVVVDGLDRAEINELAKGLRTAKRIFGLALRAELADDPRAITPQRKIVIMPSGFIDGMRKIELVGIVADLNPTSEGFSVPSHNEEIRTISLLRALAGRTPMVVVDAPTFFGTSEDAPKLSSIVGYAKRIGWEIVPNKRRVYTVALAHDHPVRDPMRIGRLAAQFPRGTVQINGESTSLADLAADRAGLEIIQGASPALLKIRRTLLTFKWPGKTGSDHPTT